MSQIPPPPGGFLPAGGFPPPGAPMGYQVPPPQKSPGMAIGSLVCGIASIFTFCIWLLSLPLAIVAIVLGFLSRKAIARGEASGSGLATAGIICGVVGLILSILTLAGLSMFGSKVKEEIERQQRIQQQQQNTSTTQP